MGKEKFPTPKSKPAEPVMAEKEKAMMAELESRKQAQQEALPEAKQTGVKTELQKAKEKEVPSALTAAPIEIKKPLTKEEKEARKAERLGFEKTELKTLIGKGALDTVGSIFGARFAWEAPKLIRDIFKKKEQRGKISDATLSLLETAQARGKKLEGGVEELAASPVASRIKELNEKLKEAKLPANEKSALRKEMAQILKEYRRDGKDLEEARTEKVGKLLDLYINNSAQKMVVAREAVNTVSIFAMMPWLRLVGYSAFAGAERAIKAADTYEKAHFREGEKQAEKLGFLAKNCT
ncbi:MAG: hypothetical protein AAB906_04250 [Patescibacteria group bacterium]